MADAAETPARMFHCSFCSKSQIEVVKMVSGPGVLICNECVTLCVNLASVATYVPGSSVTIASTGALGIR